MNTITQSTVDKMFGEVLRWNILFNVPIPDNKVPLHLLKEELDEFLNATHDRDRSDAVGDMLVIALGICARLVVKPELQPSLRKRAGSGLSKVRINHQTIQGIMDAINSSMDCSTAMNEFLEILFIHCENTALDIETVFNNIMKANWTKFWTVEEIKSMPSTMKAIYPVQGIVVHNSTGKVMKPSSFKHP